MKRALAGLATVLAAGCIGPCNVIDGCPSWTEDRARDNPLSTTKVQPLELSAVHDALKPGDAIRFESHDGKRYWARVKSVEPDAMVVWGRDEKLYRVPYHFMSKLGVERRKDAGDIAADVIYSIVTSPTTLAPAPPGL